MKTSSIVITQELSLLKSAGEGRVIWFSCIVFCVALAGHRMGYRPKAHVTIGSAVLKTQETAAASVLLSSNHVTSYVLQLAICVVALRSSGSDNILLREMS